MLYLSWLKTFNETFDSAKHAREEEFCIRGNIYEQEEGDIILSGFEVEIPNPGLGVLGLGRTERYAVLSEKRVDDLTAVELARGRVTAVPTELGQQTLTLTFQCVPPNEDKVLKAAADALRAGVEENYDPDAPESEREFAESYDALYHSRDASDDPMSALAGRLEFWRWNRKTLAIERVNIHVPSANSVTHHIDETGFEDTLSVSLKNPPRAKTRLRVQTSWTQQAKGVQTYPAIYEHIETYTWQNLIENIPQAGTAVGEATGWHIAESNIHFFEKFGIIDEYRADKEAMDLDDEDVSTVQVLLQAAKVGIHVRLGYDYEQQREEYLDITMPVSQQEILGDDKVETADVINLAPLNIDPSTKLWAVEDPTTLEPMQYSVGDFVIFNSHRWRCTRAHESTSAFPYEYFTEVTSAAPLNYTAPSFFNRPRGIRSMRYGIRMLQRRVVLRARCLELSFQCDWKLARDISCRDFVRIQNRKIGEVVGKVSAVKLVADNEKRYAEITILSCLGDGQNPPNTGPDEQKTGDVVYKLSGNNVSQPVNASALKSQSHVLSIGNDLNDQKGLLRNAPDPVTVVQNNPTVVELIVRPIREENTLSRRLTAVCKPIWLPKNAKIGA